jgi:serine/threonine protein kinase
MSEPFGAWQLEGLIAVGGLGEVWRATNGGTVAALKRLHTHLVRNDEARGQFELEQRLAQDLPRHPNVVHAIEIGAVNERPYVALELAPGEDLRRTMMPPRPEPGSTAPRATVQLPRSRVLAIVVSACEAASHLHEAGWVHGDINPGNLVVATDDHLTLIDLGVARMIGAGGTVRGTHAYMAPEQIRGEAWTPATDVFALGVVLWELANGGRLFHRGPPWLSMAAVMESTPPPLDDPMLDSIVQAALAKDPARRTQSAIAVAQRLRSTSSATL